MYDRIASEIGSDRFYVDNFANDGQRFVAWYLRRVLLLDVHQSYCQFLCFEVSLGGALQKAVDEDPSFE
jgi:hypothetical protein